MSLLFEDLRAPRRSALAQARRNTEKRTSGAMYPIVEQEDRQLRPFPPSAIFHPLRFQAQPSGLVHSPGVPQVVVNAEKVDSSIILLSPKSAMSRSESSSLERKRRFSGLRSVAARISELYVILTVSFSLYSLAALLALEQNNSEGLAEHSVRRLTTMHNPMIMQISHRTRHSRNQPRSVRLVEELLRADTVEELATLAEVGDEVDCWGA